LREIGSILVLFIVFSCSVLKRESSNNVISEKDRSLNFSLESIRKQNISNQSFFISKAEIELTSGKEVQSLICSVKFSAPDIYLISLRGRSGIEAARVFLSGDTIIVNDRINRILYYGKPDYINMKFGIPASGLPMIFGDIVNKTIIDSSALECFNGKINFNGSLDGLRYVFAADCQNAKLVNCVRINELNQEQEKISYRKYFNWGKYFGPSVINIDYKHIKMIIRIRKLVVPWDGGIDFIPGSNYELIPLK
jgi:hypothetical protein